MNKHYGIDVDPTTTDSSPIKKSTNWSRPCDNLSDTSRNSISVGLLK